MTDTLNTGDIVVSSWGYNQTNVDFYKVIKRSGSFATIKKLKASAYEDEIGTMQDKCVATDEFMPEDQCYPKSTLRRKIQPGYGNGPMLKIDSSSWATKWDGQPKYRSWYA